MNAAREENGIHEYKLLGYRYKQHEECRKKKNIVACEQMKNLEELGNDHLRIHRFPIQTRFEISR